MIIVIVPKYLLIRILSFLLIFLRAQCDFQNEKLVDKLDAMLTGLNTQRYYRSTDDDGLKIWEEYEFGTGVGNREELIVKNFHIEDEKLLPMNETKNWQFLANLQYEILACNGESNIWVDLYDDTDNDSRVDFRVNGTILTFKVMNLFNSTTNHEDIIIVLCVEHQSEVKLNWYKIVSGNFELIWSSLESKRVEKLDFFKHNERNKLMLINEPFNHDGAEYSTIKIYEFNFIGDLFDFWLCQKMKVPRISDFELCSMYEHTYLSIQSQDMISLYEFKESSETNEGLFRLSQNITSNGLKNSVCFENGYTEYLILSGPKSALFTFLEGEFLRDTEIEKLFDDLGETLWVECLPVQTYREECILLIQLKNLTVIGLTWQGHNFKIINLPQLNINNFKLSEITVIPKYGFIFENHMVKVETALNDLSRPVHDRMEEILRLKNSLEETFLKQESILDETERKIQNSYYRNPVITGFWNLSQVKTESTTISKDVSYSSLLVGSKLFTRDDVASDLTVIDEQLKSLNEKMKKIKLILSVGIPKNSPEVRCNGFSLNDGIKVLGTLYVKNLTFESLNGFTYDNIINDFVRYGKEGTIKGSKSFPSIEADNIKIIKINDVPSTDIMFDTENKNYENINFKELNELVVNGSINFSSINGFGWGKLMENVVWKNRDTVISGSTVVLGEIIADNLAVSMLNGLKYPSEYVLQNSVGEPMKIVGKKTFGDVKVGNLRGIKTINGIPYEDFVTLNKEQNLPNEITFDNLIVDESLQVDGMITGIKIDQEKHRHTLNDINVITADTMFKNLHVTGNIIVENSVNKKNLSDFDDIVLKSEKSAVIYGQKNFLGNVQIENTFRITSKRFNGHAIDEFATLKGEQVFSNLKKISAPVEFEKLEYKQLTDLEDYLKYFVEDKKVSDSKCWSKKLIFNVSPIFEDIGFHTLNKNLSALNISEKFSLTFQNVNFENLEVKRLYVGKVTPNIINDVIFSDFQNRRISTSHSQILSGNYNVKNLKAGKLKTQYINGMSLDDFEKFRQEFEDLFDRIWNGKITIDTFIVNGKIQTNTINGELLTNIYANNEMRNVIVSDGFYVRSLEVYGLVNGLNITEYVLDSVYKSDKNVLLRGQKVVDTLNCNILEFPILNGSPVQEIVNSNLRQTLSGPVLVRGNIVVKNYFDCDGKVNNVVYKELLHRIAYLRSDTFKLHGDFRFSDDVMIENLQIDGPVQGIGFKDFLNSIIFQGDDVDITGKKIFTNSVTFGQNFTIENEYNDLDLTPFNHHAVLIDEDIRIDSELVLQKDLILAGDLMVEEHLDSKTISNVDIEELKSNAIFLDRPSYVQGTLTFTNATFESSMTVHNLNNVDLNAVIPLTEDQVIFNPLLFINVSVETLEITGTLNGYKIDEILANAFMLNGNQTITGNLIFHGNVQMQNDFDPRSINGIEVSKMISLDEDEKLVGIFEFTRPLIFRKDVEVVGFVNDIDLAVWEIEAVYDNFPTKQLASGNWYIEGNVTFEKDVLGTGLLDGIDVQRLSDKLEKRSLKMDSVVTNIKMDLESTCQDLTPLQKYAKNQIHRFKFFEYFQIINFDVTIKSVHHFETERSEFLLINVEQCLLNTFVYNGTGFTITWSKHDFDGVEKWITLTYDNQVYFLTIGNGMCGKCYGNLWKFEEQKLIHILDLGNITDVKKIGDYNFLVISEEKLEKWSIQDVHSGIYGNLTSYFSTNKHMKFIPNTDRILLVDDQSIHEFDSQYLNHQSLSNYFGNGAITSLQAGIFEAEMFLHYDEGVSENNVFIFDGLSGRKIRQSISTHKPKSFSIINFDGFVETFLTFVKNGRSLEIFEYRGIEGFVYRESIKMQIDKTFGFKLRKHSGLSKTNYVAAIYGNSLTIMEAKMYGEKLDVEYLICEEY